VATLTSSTDGTWAIASASLTVGEEYLVIFSLHETYGGDTNIAGAEFKTAT
jgi:hypothetical protein